MNIKFCFFDYNINFGGAPKGSVALSALLKSDGNDVVIYDVYGKNKKYLDFIRQNKIIFRVVFSESKNIYIGGSGKIKRLIKMVFWLPEFIKIVLRTRAFLKKDNIDLIWLNNNKSLVTVSFAAIGLDVKKVLYHRGWATKGSIGFLFRLFIRWQCDALVGHSRATVSNLANLFPSKKTFYVPNSVSLNSNHQPPRNSARGNDVVVLLPAARPVYEKGHHTAVLALAVLAERGINNVILRFPGEVTVGVSDKYLTDLKVLIKKLNLTDKVEFIGWLDSLDEVIREASIVILPSHTEGFPRVIIESMLLGTPVIATPVGGIPEAIINNETGIIIAIDDADMLADAIATLISEPELGTRMAINAYDFAITNFSPAKQLEGIKEAFFEACK